MTSGKCHPCCAGYLCHRIRHVIAWNHNCWVCSQGFPLKSALHGVYCMFASCLQQTGMLTAPLPFSIHKATPSFPKLFVTNYSAAEDRSSEEIIQYLSAQPQEDVPFIRGGSRRAAECTSAALLPPSGAQGGLTQDLCWGSPAGSKSDHRLTALHQLPPNERATKCQSASYTRASH